MEEGEIEEGDGGSYRRRWQWGRNLRMKAATTDKGNDSNRHRVSNLGRERGEFLLGHVSWFN